jgi:hypothetical protein
VGGYGAPPQGAPYGQPMQPPGAQAMAPYPQAAGQFVGTLSSAGTPGKGPTKRNALMVMILPYAVIVGCNLVFGILARILDSAIIGMIGSLAALAGVGLIFYYAIKMTNELKAVTQNANLAWWPMLIPGYNVYWMWFTIPAEVARAKQMLGVQTPPRSLVLYIFLWLFAFASDINDMVR